MLLNLFFPFSTKFRCMHIPLDLKECFSTHYSYERSFLALINHHECYGKINAGTIEITKSPPDFNPLSDNPTKVDELFECVSPFCGIDA